MMNHMKPLALAVLLAVSASPVLAQTASPSSAAERESLEVLRNTTRNLIDALVETGALTRDKADKLIREAEQKAVQTAKADAAVPAPVRVQYLPETVKNDLREQLKQEVLAQAKEERWANPNIVPGWVDKVSVYGDLLVRDQFDNYSRDNTKPADYYQYAGTAARNAALADKGYASGNTVNDLNRMRLRARLGFNIKASSEVRADVRIATGSSDARNSTTQTMGSGFNKYSLWLDRAVIKYQPSLYTGLQAGRMANPFVSSDLVWDENVNFDGLALAFKPPVDEGFAPFATLGYFPLSTENTPNFTKGRSLLGAQLGASTDLGVATRARLALAYYQFHNIEGRPEGDSCWVSSGNYASCDSYGSTEYPSSWRSQGNTLVRLNAPSDPAPVSTWGLASKFSPLHLGFNLDTMPFDPVHLVFSADYVKNMAFDRAEIARRTGVSFSDGKSTGYQFRFLVGTPSITRLDEWNASLAFRRLGSDAVPDAWADSTLGGGGTNLRGFILGGAYGIADNTTLGLRYLSGRSIDSPTMLNASDKFRVETWQVDMNVRF